jgi:hypothetical protein
MERGSSPNPGRNSQMVGSGSEELASKIKLLLSLDPAALKEKWKDLFSENPSPPIGRSMLIRAIAYRLQERAFGGLKPSAQRILDRVSDGHISFESKRAPTREATAGTVLIRKWGGVTHRVTVLDHDVVYRGRRYKSLSEVARVITGTHWSGPLFFGIKNRAKVAANG